MNTTVKYTLIVVGSALAAFAVALVGAYFALPMVAPGVVAQSDSTTASDSTAQVAQATVPADSTLRNAATEGTSTGDAPPSDDTQSDASSVDTSVVPRNPGTAAKSAPVTAALRDSLEELRRRLRNANEQTASLREETETLRQQLSAAESQRVKADELSSALLKMERRELTALLEEVEMHVLQQLYQEASGRSRTRLLQSMPPARAARFVNQLVEDQESRSPTSAVASSPSTPPSE